MKTYNMVLTILDSNSYLKSAITYDLICDIDDD